MPLPGTASGSQPIQQEPSPSPQPRGTPAHSETKELPPMPKRACPSPEPVRTGAPTSALPTTTASDATVIPTPSSPSATAEPEPSVDERPPKAAKAEPAHDTEPPPSPAPSQPPPLEGAPASRTPPAVEQPPGQKPPGAAMETELEPAAAQTWRQAWNSRRARKDAPQPLSPAMLPSVPSTSSDAESEQVHPGQHGSPVGNSDAELERLEQFVAEGEAAQKALQEEVASLKAQMSEHLSEHLSEADTAIWDQVVLLEKALVKDLAAAEDEMRARLEETNEPTPKALSQRVEQMHRGPSGSRGFNYDRQNARRALKRQMLDPEVAFGAFLRRRKVIMEQHVKGLIELAPREELDRLPLASWAHGEYNSCEPQPKFNNSNIPKHTQTKLTVHRILVIPRMSVFVFKINI